MISIDITLLFQVVNFLITLVLLNYLIIRPIREVVARRRALNSGLLGDAQSMNTEAARKLESYEARLLRTRAEMAATREAAKQAAGKESVVRLDAAAGDARSIRQEATERLHGESVEAQRTLEARVDDFARQAVSRVLGA